jgi:predicted SAM-dependent methyltransferase
MIPKRWLRFDRRLIPRGVRNALRELVRECEIAFVHGRSVRRHRREHIAIPFQLNLGCGSRPKAGWLNVDLAPDADLQLDIRRELPFRKASVSRVYSEHFFEHLEYPDEVQGLLAEIRRVLCPGGLLRLVVPDTQEILFAYVNRDEEWFRITKERWHPSWCDTPLHSVNYHFRQHSQHKYAYDFETLSRVLEQSGFESVEERKFDPEIDSVERERGSLYVEAACPVSQVGAVRPGASD